MAEENTCQTQFWLKLTLLSLQDVQRFLRELEHNCTSRARRSSPRVHLGWLWVAWSGIDPESWVRPLPSQTSQTFSFRTLGVILVLWGWFSYFGGNSRPIIGPHALDYALCSHAPRYPHFSNMKLQPAHRLKLKNNISSLSLLDVFMWRVPP